MKCVVSIPKKMRVLADITLASEEKRNKGKRKHSDTFENNWTLASKIPKIEENENHFLKYGNPENIENGSLKKENFVFETEPSAKKQKCHVCNLEFENLDVHFLTSHSDIPSWY